MRRILVSLLGFLAACRSPSPAEAGPAFEERLLATIPEGVEVFVPIAFSRDGRQAAYVAQTSGGYWAVRGSWKSRRLDAI
ncbi:MAG TPA: hypothetical protein VGK61_04010 [Planctomycetota bacterium]|jgi:hypothetical protein